MALINCPECNKQISNKAVSCPHCGFPMRLNFNDNKTDHERDSYNVILQSAFGNKMNAIKGVKSIFHVGLAEAKDIVDKAPSVLKRNTSFEDANKIKVELEAYGATIVIVPYDANEDESLLLKQYETNEIHCPHCGSTAITTGQRGFSFLTGFLGSNKTVNRCGKCGYSWKP